MDSPNELSITNIADLVSYLRQNTVSLSTGDAFNLLNDILGDSIAIRYELVNTGDQDNTAVTASTNDVKKGKYDYLDDKVVSRVLLTARRNKADFSRELTRHLNGVILEYPSWNVLTVPTPMFNPRYREVDIIGNLDHYSIYEIKDGTTVTLYYRCTDDKSGWCASTTNGFDVSDYTWMGSKTYMHAIEECLKQYPDFNMDKLDKTASYTIGFRCNDFHPLATDPSKIWLVQMCNVSELNTSEPKLVVSNSVDIGLPLQVAIVKSCEPHELMKWMKAVNDSAISSYIDSLRDDFIKPPHYGFFLRANSTLPVKYRMISDIILESSLLKLVRGLVYNLPKRRFEKDAPITSTTRQEYTVLRAYLGHSKYNFITLFPQFKPYYAKYDTLFMQITMNIITTLKKPTVRLPASASKKEILIYKLAEHIRVENVNVFNTDGPGIIQDFLNDTNNLELYYSFLIAE
jgi:hypothetical protein